MHEKKSFTRLPRHIAAALLASLAMSAHAEVYYEYVPVLDVRPIIETRRVPVREQICEHREPENRLTLAATGDVRQGRPTLSIRAAAREDRQLWAEFAGTPKRCRTTERYARKQEIAGYRVEYVYGSERLVTRMDHDPGERVRVRVELNPMDRREAGWARTFSPSGRSRYR